MKDPTCLLCEFEPKTIREALENEDWIKAMNEEIDQIEKNDTWTLVPRLENKNVIRTKWVFRNKHNEHGKITRNKARLVCKGYAQEEGIVFWETFSRVASLERVRTLLAYATYKDFKVFQMDVKSKFLNGILEEVYVEKPEGFVDPNKRHMVCKLNKALYGLKQASRAWYERLYNYLIQIGFSRTNDTSNLYMKDEEGKEILLAKIFIDDIIFGGQDALCKKFSNEMQIEFEMSVFGEIKFFVGLQVYQMEKGIFITQSKYFKEILKTFGMEDSRLVCTPMDTG